MTSKTNWQKRAWEETECGALEKKVKKFFASGDNGARWTDEDQKWVDKHRAASLTKESALVTEFEEAQEDLKKEYKEKFEAHMTDVYQTELDYLSEVEKRPVPTIE